MNRILTRILILLALLLPAGAAAQLVTGGWTLHTPFLGVESMAETEVYLYYMSRGALYRVDKETSEVEPLNISTRLHDSKITGIYPDMECRSMVVAYASGNIDRIYDDGRVVNISDIKDVVMTEERRINTVEFGKNSFFVGTNFGMIIFDERKNEVRRTIFTPFPVEQIVAIGNHVGLYNTSDRILRFARNDASLTSYDSFKVMGGYSTPASWNRMMGCGDSSAYFLNFYSGTYHLHKFTIDFEKGTHTLAPVIENGYATLATSNMKLRLCRAPKGTIYAFNNRGIFVMAPDGTESYHGFPEGAVPSMLAYHADFSRLWVGDATGVKLTDGATGKVMADIASRSTLKFSNVSNIYKSPTGKIYISNLGEHLTFGLADAEDKKRQFVHLIGDNGEFIDISSTDVQTENSTSNSYTPTVPHHVAYGTRLFEDPTDPEAYYTGSWFEGAYRIKNGKQTHKYYTSNAGLTPFASGWACVVNTPIVDRSGNLWLFQYITKDPSQRRLYVLPAKKRMASNVTPDDFKPYVLPKIATDYRDGFATLLNRADMIVYAPGRWSKCLIFIDTKGTEALSDDVMYAIDEYVDQDSKSLAFSHILCVREDARGRLWIGTDVGVFEITNPGKINSSEPLQVNHLKVPRNDGTNLADYLLDSQIVSSIDIDSANRKWISTIGSGVYLVSENGDQILEHYTTENSILPSNDVYSLACSPTSSRVYFGVVGGVVEYNSTSSPGKADYSEVTAYPNPVRPDYNGWITITGLMDNSLVKITDAAGNIIHQGLSNGGTYVWDGCTSAGTRVAAGVYYVLASRASIGAPESTVAKILVIS